MTDLWTEATRDIEAEDAARRLTAARIEAEPLLPFLKQASSVEDFDMRVSLAEDRLMATAGDQAAQVVAEARREVMERIAAGRCRCGKKSCSCTGSCACKDGCACAPCNQKKEAKRTFRVEADAAGGGYYVVDDQTGQDVGNYPTQTAAEQAAAAQPGLEVEPTGNPAAPGTTAPTSVAPQGPAGQTAGPTMPPAEVGSAPLAMDTDGDGTPDAADPDAAKAPAGAEQAPTPSSAPTGEGDANQDDPSDAVGNDESTDPAKTAAKVATVGEFKIALQEGEDPLLPLLQLMDNGQGQPEQPSYHTDSQQQLGAPSNHANGEIGTKDPQGDFMDLEKKSSSVDNPFAKSAMTKTAIFFNVADEVPARGGGTMPNYEGKQKQRQINTAVDEPTHQVLGDTHGKLIEPSKEHDDWSGHGGHDHESLKGLVGHHVTVAGLGVSGMTGRHVTGRVVGTSKNILPDNKEGYTDHPIWQHHDAGFHYSDKSKGYLHVVHQMGDWGGTQTMHGLIPIGGVRHVVDHGPDGVKKREKDTQG